MGGDFLFPAKGLPSVDQVVRDFDRWYQPVPAIDPQNTLC